MKIRRGLVATLTVALGSLALAACGSSDASTSSSDEAVTVAIGIPWNGAAGKLPVVTGPLGYAIDKGLAQPIFEEHGFKLGKPVGFNNGPPIAQALQSGDLQVGVIGDTPAVLSKASGLDLDAVTIARPTADIWFLTKVGGVKSIKELAGKKVALQFGSNFDKYGRAVLEQNGVLDDVELVNLLFADALPALDRGEVDAVPVPASTAGLWRKTADFPVLSKASVDNPELLATTVSLVSHDFYEKHPEIAKAVWEATKAGQEAIEEDHDDFVDFVAEATGAPAEVVADEQLFRYGTEPADAEGLTAVASTLQFLLDAGTVKQGFDTDAWTVR